MGLPHHASGERDHIAMPTLTVVRQYLAAVFLLVIGLVAYGCGDSATVNPVVELASLTVDPGTLQPAFSGGTTQYNVDISSNITSVTITAQPAVAGDSVTINGQATTNSVIPLGAVGTTTAVNIVVSESGTSSRTYVVLINRAAGNNSLQNLTVSPGDLAPEFDMNTLGYTADVANNVGSVNVTPTLQDSAATMTVNGQPTNSGQTRTITLNPPGQSSNISIIVTAQNATPKTYVVTVSRGVSGNNNLQGLTVSPGNLAPSFRADRTGYTVNVGSSVASITLTPRLQDTAAAIMTVNGQDTNSGQARTIPLGAAGSNTPIFIVVTAQNGTQKTYTVGINRADLNGNNNLRSLAVSPGTLAPSFDEDLLNYTVDVANNVGTINVTPTLDDSNATMMVNGQPTNSGQAQTITLNPAGQSTNVSIVVTAQNGNAKTYLVTVSRGVSSNNNLQSLTVSPGTLNPSFNASRTSYTVNVASTVTSVTITPRLQDTTAATMTVNGQATNSGQAQTIQLGPEGSNTPIFIIVTAQNGTQKTYTAGVNRAALGGNNNLSGLSVSPGTLAPPFDEGLLAYTVAVGSNVESVSVTPTRQDANATITVNGQVTSSGQARTANLNPAGQSTFIPIVVTAQNGSQKTYAMTIARAALGGNNNLSGLTVSPGPLAPAFTAAETNYTVDVGSSISSITVTPTRQDSNATITVNGTPATSGQGRSITLNGAGSNTLINIVVTAPNGSQKPYTITVERAALGGNNNLSGLTVSPGSLTPLFTAARTAYAVNNVGSSATAILVTSTPQDPSATVTINGQGGNSRSIPLPGGPSSTEIEVLVIAPNGSNRTYLVTVNQPAPAAPPAPPASAPDLVEADDSCPLNNVVGGDPTQCLPGTSRVDNVTNFTTPRFTIPQPGPGETPNLYVDGTRVDSTFDQGTSTLKPNTALNGSNTGVQHSITSTVTNTATTLESDESDALTVIISTGQSGV